MKTKILLLLAAIIIVAPISWVILSLTKADLDLLRKTKKGSSDIVVLGNSVVDFISKCDTDQFTIPQYLEASTQSNIADLSKGGHTFWENLAYARLYSKTHKVNKTIFMCSPASYALSHLQSREIRAKNILFNGVLGGRWRLAFPMSMEDAPVNLDDSSLEYKGVAYGNYKDITKIFLIEDKMWSCPEGTPKNPKFFEFMYWRSLQKLTPKDYDFELVANELNDLSQNAGKILVVMEPQAKSVYDSVLGPVEFNKVATFNRELGAALAKKGIDYLDLGAALPREAFSQQWCACGHLSQLGRKAVADSIHTWLSR